MKVLLIEDEKHLIKNIATYLKRESYHCEVADDFRTAIEKIEIFDYDCILLDISLPDGNGLHVLKELKANKKTDGVIIISARDSVDDRIAGLQSGADDYLAKPFHLSELGARVATVIRRRRFKGNMVIVLGDVTIDTSARIVSVHNKSIDLTKKEYDLLLYFGSNPNRVVSKNAIVEHICGDHADAYDNLDVIYAHIKNLKKKLAAAGSAVLIKSVYGMGYKLER